MRHATNNDFFTVGSSTYRICQKPKKRGIETHALKQVVGQVESMLSYHSKLIVIRFDLKVWEFTLDNKDITTFNRRLFKWLKSRYELKRIGFVWCREIEKAKKQHYHYALILDGHKVRHSELIINKAKSIWEQFQRHLYVPKNCYHPIKRNDFSSIQGAIYRLSYLAKARGKGYKPAQTKNYGTSRIEHNDKRRTAPA
ncbi:inovirus-type Gp2 protein [Alteromonas sp. MmMcT2-5]|uniref:YagK/YfjJ domain-containing protein n=1 Tax=Alteromonas sp. MmMcT2-5 TaxID=2917733 RepID=UPI001EF2F225|nr:inovirus-type Gp2 protein [Alteromonas sp. MmMcT2-5]MCG7650991.1 inovirus Gp2 family protein [Alteromonas sp. MmMcT2-5]